MYEYAVTGFVVGVTPAYYFLSLDCCFLEFLALELCLSNFRNALDTVGNFNI
jgi:hypothetical protein